MLRLLHLIHDNRLGGVSKRALMVAKEMRRHQIEAVFAVPDEDGEVDLFVQKEGFSVYRLPMPRPSLRPSRWFACLQWLLAFPLTLWSIIRLVRVERIDLIHVNGLVNLPALVAAFFVRRPIIVHLCGTDYPRVLCRLLMPWISNQATVIAISPRVADFFYEGIDRDDPPNVIFEPVAANSFQNTVSSGDRDELRQSMGIRSSDFVFLSVGNVSERKGFHFLVEAASKLKLRGVDIKILLVGAFLEGHETYLKRLNDLIQANGLTDSVFLLGKRDDIPDLMTAADSFVLASRSEGTPLVIMEAMSAGKAVISTRVGGVPDMINDGEDGLLVPSEDSTILSEAMEAIVRDPSMGKRLGGKARIVAMEKFSIDHHTEVFVSLLKSTHQRNEP